MARALGKLIRGEDGGEPGVAGYSEENPPERTPKERERAAMGERSAMAGAWKEDEDRERTTRGWTPFGIIALLHTSAARP